MQTKRIKIHRISIILTGVLLLLCFVSKGENTRLTMHKPARNLISEKRIGMEIGFLSDSLCDGRATGSRGGAEAASWVARKFSSTGLLMVNGSWVKAFRTEIGAIGHNVVGFLAGSAKKHPDSYVIVGAHYDHLGNIGGKHYPGADANASGVVAMTSVAEMLSMTRMIGKSFSSNILFVAFDGKEMGMAGSQALWDMIEEGSLADPVSGRMITKEKIAFMANIDQIGSVLAPIREDRKDYIIMLGNPTIKSAYNDMLKVCNDSYDIDLNLGFTYYGSENFTKLFYRLSDQKVFADNRIPAVMFTSGITMNNNKPYDTVRTLDLKVLKRRIYLIYHWIEKML
jgi:Zn-dependent M28 family amino/carboxypeptidase